MEKCKALMSAKIQSAAVIRCSNKGVLDVSIIEHLKLAAYMARLPKVAKLATRHQLCRLLWTA